MNYQTLRNTANMTERMVLYRFTVGDTGIYDALHSAMSFESWREFLKSPAATWLPKPPEGTYTGYDSYESYFTKTGYVKFKSTTLPMIKRYIPASHIKERTSMNVSGDIIYQDEYQIVYGKKEVKI